MDRGFACMVLALIPAAESKEKRIDVPHNMGESRSMMFSEKPPPLMAATLHSEGPSTTCVPICCSVGIWAFNCSEDQRRGHVFYVLPRTVPREAHSTDSSDMAGGGGEAWQRMERLALSPQSLVLLHLLLSCPQGLLRQGRHGCADSMSWPSRDSLQLSPPGV